MSVRDQVGRGLIDDYWCGIYEDKDSPSSDTTDDRLVINWKGREWTLTWENVLGVIEAMESDKKRVWNSLKTMNDMTEADRKWLEERNGGRKITKKV